MPRILGLNLTLPLARTKYSTIQELFGLLNQGTRNSIDLLDVLRQEMLTSARPEAFLLSLIILCLLPTLKGPNKLALKTAIE